MSDSVRGGAVAQDGRVDDAPGEGLALVAAPPRGTLSATGTLQPAPPPGEPAPAEPAAAAPAPSAPPLPVALAVSSEAGGQEAPKYRVERLLAEGSEGQVYLVTDRDLERRIAMKVMRSETAHDARRVSRFLNEARRTASLQHASIPAVHDLGYSSTGELYFTMRLVQGRTLRHVLQSLRAGEADVQRAWTLTRLVQVLQQVANGVHYAHSRGLLHRDLKPDNIGLGEYGEVLVLDWGLAKRIGADPEEEVLPASKTAPVAATQLGVVKGTPLYMAPEQARGAIDQLDVRTDVFSLGAILYEALCLEPPYEGYSVAEVVEQARAGRIPPPGDRVRGRDLPRVLVDTAMRALSFDPSCRHGTAGEFANDLQAYLEGGKEKELRRLEAHGLIETGRRMMRRSRELRDEAGELERRGIELVTEVPAWAGEESKAELWDVEDRCQRLRIDAADAYARAVDLISRSLAHDPENLDARALMSRLYFERYVHAERVENLEDAAWLRRMVERYNDGALDEALRDSGRITVTTEPAQATVRLTRLIERGRRLVPSDVHDLGEAPVACEALPRGSYLVETWAEACLPSRVPVFLGRGEEKSLCVPMLRQEGVPQGFVWVPGGPFVSGSGADRRDVEVAGFVIAEVPVLLREYAEWLDDLAQTDADAAAQHVPWTDSHGPLLKLVAGRHEFCEASPLSSHPVEPHPDLPVVGITRDSAEAYATWRSEKIGFHFDLPTELQWEKAARGTDGRLYPWGEHFDASFCSMVDSTVDAANLRPAGAFPVDESPYGVRDMAGGVREWCRGDVDAGRRTAVCRGGGWYLAAAECTVTSRWLVDPATKSPGVGFRLVVEVE